MPRRQRAAGIGKTRHRQQYITMDEPGAAEQSGQQQHPAHAGQADGGQDGLAADRNRVVIHHQHAIDGLRFCCAVATGAGRLVGHRVEAAHDFAPLCIQGELGVERDRGGLWRAIQAQPIRPQGKDFAELRRVGGEADFPVGRDDHRAAHPFLLPHLADDFTQSGQVALEHGVLQSRLQQPVDLARGLAALLRQLVLISRRRQADQGQRKSDQSRRRAQQKLVSQTRDLKKGHAIPRISMRLPGVLINTWQTIASAASVGWISAAQPPFSAVIVDAGRLHR